ncbi:hypothetical protein T484DRAFT_1934491, partial [Baffinella frigidus]
MSGDNTSRRWLRLSAIFVPALLTATALVLVVLHASSPGKDVALAELGVAAGAEGGRGGAVTEQLFQLQKLALSDEIHIKMPHSAHRWKKVWGDEGWTEVRTAARAANPAASRRRAQPQSRGRAHARGAMTTALHSLQRNHVFYRPGGGDSPPMGHNPEGVPGGTVRYETDDVSGGGPGDISVRYYAPRPMGAPEQQAYSVSEPRSPLMAGELADLGTAGSASAESDRGLLDQHDHDVPYVDEEGHPKKFREQGLINSAHQGHRLLCITNCDIETGGRDTPVGTFTGDVASDQWPTLPAAVKALAAEDDDEDEEPKSAVEEETGKIGAALKGLRDRQKAQDQLHEDDGLDAMEEAHGKAEEDLEEAHKTVEDNIDEAEISSSIKGLETEYKNAELALDYAKKGDFSYMAKITGGGALEDFYRSEDPLLLHSIRRGDFVEKPGPLPKPYVDGQGNEISRENKKELSWNMTDELVDLDKQASRQMNTLPLLPSHMFGDDQPKEEEDGNSKKAHVYVPLKHLDQLCLLCESLSGSGALSSIPACQGMSCESGSWKDSDVAHVYDEDDLNPVLHPDRPQYQGGERFSDNTPVYQDGPPEKKKEREEDFLTEAEKAIWPNTKAAPEFSRPRALKAVGSRQGGAGVVQSLASISPVAAGLSEAQVRREACEFLAASTVPEVVRIKFGARWLKSHYAQKFGKPLRCKGSGSRAHPTSRLAASDFATPKRGQLLAAGKEGGADADKEVEAEADKEGAAEEGGDDAGAPPATVQSPDIPKKLQGEDGEELGADAEDPEEKEDEEEKEEQEGEDGAEDKEEEEEEKEEEEADAGSVYLYVGKDAKAGFQYKMEDILANQQLGGGPVEVKTFQSLSKEAIRAVVWGPDCSVIMFPPFFSFPDFPPSAEADLKGYVRAGGELKGNVMFVGGGLEVEVINKMFGWSIKSKYAGGPYYKNERNAREDNSFGMLPNMVPEVGNVYGMWLESLPPNSHSFYDSFGVP